MGYTNTLWQIEYADAERTIPLTIRAKAFNRSALASDEKGNVICGFTESHQDNKDAMAEALENAFLISALPELIDAAIAAHWYMCHTIRADGQCQGCKLGAAIAKALNKPNTPIIDTGELAPGEIV